MAVVDHTSTKRGPKIWPSQERLRELFDYDPNTGLLTWKIQRQRIKPGTLAGCIHAQGYVRVHIDYRLYPAHRLAWIHTYGENPSLNTTTLMAIGQITV